MGWASGSGLLTSVWATVRPWIGETDRAMVLAQLMGVFANEDCDTLDEVVCDEWPETQEAYEVWQLKP